jgi:hypothetical protein
MSRAVPRATGQRVGMGAGRGAKQRPQPIDFKYLDGLSGKADKEIRATEDALVEFIEQERRREALYADTASNLDAKYPALKKEGVR